MSLPTVMRRRLRLLGWPPGDVLLALGLLGFALAEIVGLADLPRHVAVPAAAGMALPLLWRRRAPVVVVAVVVGTFVVQTTLGVPASAQLAPLVAVLCACYSVGAHAEGRRGVGGLVLALLLAGATVPSAPGWGISDFGFIGVVLGGAWGLGRLVGSRTAEAHRHERHAEQVLAASEERVRQAVEVERRRIARELHDIISHSLSLMVIQAGAAEEVLAVDPGRVAPPLRTIQRTGREALEDMKRLLGVLQAPDLDDHLHPQPGLDDLGELVDQLRAAGLPVELSVVGPPRPGGVGAELSAYRIVQECLTNVMKHAPGANVEVTVRYERDMLQIEVVDDGRGQPLQVGAGSGLTNMQERAQLFGGVVSAAPRPDGGFGVRVRLPFVASPER